jgi:hypothetical protein
VWEGDIVSDERVLVDGVPLDRTVGTTDVHLRGVPVLMPVVKVRKSKMNDAGRPRRRPNSRVVVRRVAVGGKPVTGERMLRHLANCEPEPEV